MNAKDKKLTKEEILKDPEYEVIREAYDADSPNIANLSYEIAKKFEETGKKKKGKK